MPLVSDRPEERARCPADWGWADDVAVELWRIKLRSYSDDGRHNGKNATHDKRPPLPAHAGDDSSAPARLFIQADVQCGLRHHFVRQEGISGMDSPQPGIANQALVAGRAKDAQAARYVQPNVHDAPRAFDSAVFGEKIFAARPRRDLRRLTSPRRRFPDVVQSIPVR